MTAIPPFPRRAMGEMFKQMRAAKGWSYNRAAAELGVSRDKLKSLEEGNTRVPIVVIRGICKTYDMGPDVEHELIALSESRSKHGWMEQFGESIPRYAQKFVAMESRANRMLIYESEFVTGLFQIGSYIRANHASDYRYGTTASETILKARLARQREFLKQDDPPEIRAIFNESVLRRIVGGAEVMAEQFEHLREANRLPNVNISILPFKAGPHPSMSGSYTVLDFSDDEPSVVYMESRDGCRYETGPKVVEMYRNDHNETDRLSKSLEEFADDRTVA